MIGESTDQVLTGPLDSTWFLDDTVTGVGDLLPLRFIWVLVLHEEAAESHSHTSKSVPTFHVSSFRPL